MVHLIASQICQNNDCMIQYGWIYIVPISLFLRVFFKTGTVQKLFVPEGGIVSVHFSGSVSKIWKKSI